MLRAKATQARMVNQTGALDAPASAHMFVLPESPVADGLELVTVEPTSAILIGTEVLWPVKELEKTTYLIYVNV